MAAEFKIGIKKATALAGYAGDVCDLYFLDTIQDPSQYDWSSGEYVQGNLVADVIDKVNTYAPSTIRMHIDSLGGSLPIALSLYNFLKNYPAKVECDIIGFCASAATVLACAASAGKLKMPESGFHITHEASANGVSGTVKDLEDAIKYTDKLTQQMAEILAARNTKGHTAEEIRALWKDGDCWMTGREAEEYGFVDGCFEGKAVMVTARMDEAKKLYKTGREFGVTANGEPDILNTLKKEFMNLKELVSAALENIKGKKVDPKTEITAQVAEALAQPLFDLTAGIESQVTAEVAKHATALESLKSEYAASLTDLTAKNETLARDLEAVTADLQKLLGRQAPATGRESDAPTANVLKGKFVKS